MKVESESEVTQSCLTLSDPMDCSLPGSSVHGIFQARVLEWGAIAFSIWTMGTVIFEVIVSLLCIHYLTYLSTPYKVWSLWWLFFSWGNWSSEKGNEMSWINCKDWESIPTRLSSIQTPSSGIPRTTFTSGQLATNSQALWPHSCLILYQNDTQDSGKHYLWPQFYDSERMQIRICPPTWWTWVWVDSRSWWWTGRPGVLQFMGSQRSDATERLNWTEERDAQGRVQRVLSSSSCGVMGGSTSAWSQGGNSVHRVLPTKEPLISRVLTGAWSHSVQWPTFCLQHRLEVQLVPQSWRVWTELSDWKLPS